MNMKKLLVVIGLSIGLVSANAQNHLTQSFLASGISSVTCSNLVNPTNLVSSISWGTNAWGTTFTNLGSQVTVTNGYAETVNPFVNSVALWVDREGRPYTQVSTNVTTPAIVPSPMKVVIKTIAGAVADSAVTFEFSPVYDNIGDGTEPTGSVESWIWSFTPTVSTTQVMSTNVPLYQWVGAKGLRLRRVTNADTTTGDGSVKLVTCELVGFRP